MTAPDTAPRHPLFKYIEDRKAAGHPGSNLEIAAEWRPSCTLKILERELPHYRAARESFPLWTYDRSAWGGTGAPWALRRLFSPLQRWHWLNRRLQTALPDGFVLVGWHPEHPLAVVKPRPGVEPTSHYLGACPSNRHAPV